MSGSTSTDPLASALTTARAIAAAEGSHSGPYRAQAATEIEDWLSDLLAKLREAEAADHDFAEANGAVARAARAWFPTP